MTAWRAATAWSSPGAVAQREDETGSPHRSGDRGGERADHAGYAAEDTGDQHAEDAHQRRDDGGR